jgi:uncharacterized Zn finger protein (UPF0148 family)
MTKDNTKTANTQPIINFKTTNGLTDYYCHFCDQKLFRGKVVSFNMVCPNCNKLVRSKPDDDTKNEN